MYVGVVISGWVGSLSDPDPSLRQVLATSE